MPACNVLRWGGGGRNENCAPIGTVLGEEGGMTSSMFVGGGLEKGMTNVRTLRGRSPVALDYRLGSNPRLVF